MNKKQAIRAVSIDIEERFCKDMPIPQSAWMNELTKLGHEVMGQALPNVAFLGVGLMGKPMATRLIHAGYPLTVWNRTKTKAEELKSFSASIVDTPEAAVSHADIVITMLQDGAAVAAVLDQAFSWLRKGAVIIDMSSTQQGEAQELYRKLREQEVSFLDAPVSGGVLGAEAGSLAIMVGGEEKVFRQVEPVLQVMGRPTLVGPAGCGQLAKLCNQLIVGGTLNIIAEALLLAQAGGANPTAVRAAIRGGFAESRILEVHGQRMLDRNFLPGGQVKSQTKDLENVLIAATAAAIHLPVTELVTQRYRSILQDIPQADQSAALLALEQINPGKRVGTQPDQLP